MTRHKIDYLIVGQGLAGTVFAWTALQAGKSVLLMDPHPEKAASQVAAGLMNPITGKRLNLGWKIDELWPAATAFYRSVEAVLRERFFEEVPLIRLFVDDGQSQLWNQKQDKELYRPYWRPLPEDARENYETEHGGFETLQAGRLRVCPFLTHSVIHFDSLGALLAERVEWPGSLPGANQVVWCQGHHSRGCGPFDWVPVRPGKGEILELEIPELHERRILNRKHWLAPESADLYLAGSTFDWDRKDTEPTAAGQAEIEAGLQGFLKAPYRVVGRKAGIRAMANQGRPLLGTHPDHPRMAFLNGLGAKGALLAPYCARLLFDHLENGTPLDPGIDIRRFWNP